uniref:Uncharacterized protein n=1 Tax=Rhizophora mucronata TaxID=61149 RepID=A0A2P2PCP4_RHIMU
MVLFVVSLCMWRKGKILVFSFDAHCL